jgi:hypothetical protein
MLEFLTQYNQQVLKTVQSIFISLAVLAGANPSPIILPTQEVDLTPIHQEIRELGANISSIADFRTSLSSGITSSATTMTLSSFTSGSDSLVVGETYGFKIGGREYVIGTASTNNQIISMTRGVSRITGTTTISAYQTSWGRATAVEMTDAPILIRTSNILGGKQNLENVIRYDSTVSTSTIASDNKNLVNTELLNYVAFNGAGVVNASTLIKGVTEIATNLEARSSTATGGTGATLVLPASLATSTYNSATASSSIVMTGYTGKIDDNFLATSSYAIGKNFKIFTSSGFFTPPAGVVKIHVRVVGGGGGGGGGENISTPHAGSGGASGGYCDTYADVSATSSIKVTIGTGGPGGTPPGASAPATGTNGTPTYFSTFCSATGGLGGIGISAYLNTGTPVLGGTSTLGFINISGGPGKVGTTTFSGAGGDNPLGTAPIGRSTQGNGTNATECGTGGSGALILSGNANGGDGKDGCVLLDW